VPSEKRLSPLALFRLLLTCDLRGCPQRTSDLRPERGHVCGFSLTGDMEGAVFSIRWIVRGFRH
jgi:hypothetical protein